MSRNAVWALDGEVGTLRRLPVPAGWTPSSPQLSHDGRWLAYTTAESTTRFPTTVELWLARGDGSGAHRVRGLDVDRVVGWNPATDVLAVVGGAKSGSTLELLRPDSPTQTLVALTGAPARYRAVWSAAWSPNGREIAVATQEFGGPADGATIRAFPLAGGAPTTWFRLRTDQRFPDHICSHCGGAREVIADVVGWWPRWGMGFWVRCCGGTNDLDGSPLAVISRPGARPHLLTQTLSDGVTDAVAAGAQGALALVADATSPNSGREIGAGKSVEACDVGAQSCTPVPGATTWTGPDRQRCVIPKQSVKQCLGVVVPPAGQPGSGVSLDPAWSPGVTLLAYVRAPVALTGGWPDAAWYAAHALYTWNPSTGATRRIGGIDGANVPTWSADGRELLYVRDDGRWLASGARGSRVEIAYPLFPPAGLYKGFTDDYYGQIPWNAQFAWWSPGRG